MDDKQAVLRANEDFYTALETLDPEVMKAVWAQRPTDICVHPGWDILRGPEVIHESWTAIFANTGYMRFEPSDIDLEISGDMARVSCIENIFTVVEGHTIHSRVACINLFRRCDEFDGEWKMTVHHASPIAQGQTVVAIEPEDDEDVH